ncbi:DinB family protein [Mucilaginibacter pocheonensis]|uniref:Damage-inducible protein DinB n=1 Tax=Mucilaginibacter pocheonensis TaxID=398050 RepID=A0ABU1THW2_9SPHI|nr:DinB family protein [Mucilaginibacter pocheonensis]MDR6944386.1 putative damage-inducible protein DinB [Mucilaginibacter pocheonensis]
MKKLTLLFTLMVTVFACATASAQVSNDQMLADWQRAKNYTKAYLDAMPDDGYSFKPTPEMRSFAGQMLHLTDANYFFGSTASGKPSPLGKTSAEKTVEQTKAATTKAVMDSYDYVISAIQGMTPAQQQETVKFGGKDVSKATVLGKAFEHQTHHRGQTTVYLRLKGVTPPPEML